MTAHNPDGGTTWYREDHCVLRWPMVAAGLIAPAVVIAIFVLGVVLQSPALFPVMLVPIVFWIARGQLLPHWWPIGIRLRADGVAIGGVRWAERHPGKTRRKASVLDQGYRVFYCPWDGVTAIRVETDPGRLKDLRRDATYGRRRTPLGLLSVPFMTAALVIQLDTTAATLPDIHRARNPLAVNYSSPGYHQGWWAAPTRHPERLRKVLASLPLPPGVVLTPDTTGQSLGSGPTAS